jgi:hypothetical protein
MDSQQVRHVVRAASGITEQTVFVVIGSQAALFQFPDLPQAMRLSPELDIYPRDAVAMADLIDGLIGRDSMFHETFGYYADGVGPETARLPRDWSDRAHSFGVSSPSGEVIVIAPDIDDLAVSKLLAGREKDLVWLAEGKAQGLIDLQKVRLLLLGAEAVADELVLAGGRIDRLEAGWSPP